MTSLQQLINNALSPNSMQARTLAKIVGKIISMGLAVGPVSRFMTRSMYTLLETRHAWCEQLIFSPEALEELRFWANSIADYSSQPIWHFPGAVRVVYSDASDTGYGGYVVEHGPAVVNEQK